jgi:hypothetical protein
LTNILQRVYLNKSNKREKMPAHHKPSLSKEQEELLALAREALKKSDFTRPPDNRKEMPSIGLSCTCFGRMLPDPDCPLHCGDLIRLG